MASPINISFSQQSIYPGSTTQAKIVIDVSKRTKVRNITARLHGFEKAEAEYSETDADGDRKTKTATTRVELLSEEFLLTGDKRKGFFGRLGDSASTLVGGGDHELIEPGTYEYTLDLNIPESAPPSIKGRLSRVEYSFSVQVDIPVKIDWKKTIPLRVLPVEQTFDQSQPAQASFPDESGRSMWQKAFGKDVTMNLAIDRDYLAAGEQALAILTVDSAEPLKVTKIEIKLVGKESTDVRSHRDSHFHEVRLGQIDSPNVIAGPSVHEFEILVPPLTVPHSQIGKNFAVLWRFEAQIHIPWASDPVIGVPMTLLPQSVRAGKSS